MNKKQRRERLKAFKLLNKTRKSILRIYGNADAHDQALVSRCLAWEISNFINFSKGGNRKEKIE